MLNTQSESATPSRNANREKKLQEFAAVIVALIEDEAAVRKAPSRDLAVIEGVLAAILDSVAKELQRRDRSNGGG